MAAKFTFRFNSLLNLKEKLEDERKNQYGLAIQKLEQEKEYLDNMIEQKQKLEEEWKGKMQNIIQVKTLQERASHAKHMQQLIDRQQNVIKTCEEEVRQQRIKLLEATKERKAFEKLKEKDYEHYQHEQNIAESIFLDQFVSYKSTVK